MKLHHLRVFRASNVSGVSIGAGARDVTELAAKSISAPGRVWVRRISVSRLTWSCVGGSCCLFLFMLLTFEMLFVRLRSSARDLAHLTVVKLRRLWRGTRFDRLGSCTSALGWRFPCPLLSCSNVRRVNSECRVYRSISSSRCYDSWWRLSVHGGFLLLRYSMGAVRVGRRTLKPKDSVKSTLGINFPFF